MKNNLVFTLLLLCSLTAGAQTSVELFPHLADSLERVLAQPMTDLERCKPLMQLGYLYQKMGKNGEALAKFEAVRTIGSQNNKPEWLGRGMSGVSMVYELQGEYKQSLAISKEAVALLLPADTTWAAVFELNIGHLLGAYFEKYESALNHLKIAISLLETQQTPDAQRYLALAYSEGGMCSLIAGHQEEAVGMLLKALQMQRALGDKAAEAMTCRNLTSVYIEKKNFAKAHEYLDKALEISKEEGDQTIVLLAVSFNRGEAYAAEDKTAEAIAAFEKAVQYALEIPMYPHAKTACEMLVKLYKKAGDRTRAAEYRAKAKACERDTQLTEQQAS